MSQKKGPFTVWKFQDFSVTQILREIIFGESRRSKTAVFAIIEALKMIDSVYFSLQKVQKFIKHQNLEPLDGLK